MGRFHGKRRLDRCLRRYLGRMLAGAFLLLAAIGPVRADFVGHGAPVRDIVLSADGAYAATAGFDDQVILWDVASRQPLHRLLGHEAAVNAVAFVPAGTEGAQPDRVVSASDDGSLRVWDIAAGSELVRLDGHEKKVVAVAVSPDGRYIASASWDRTVGLWEAASGRLIARFEGHEDSINAVAFTADGKEIVSAGYDGQIWFWPGNGDGEPRRFAAAGFPINDIAFIPERELLVTASADQRLRVWDLASQQEVNRLEGHEGAVLTVAAAPGSDVIASGGTDGQIHLWDLRAGEISSIHIEHYNAVWSISFSPDGEIVYAAGIDAIARAWYVADGQPLLGSTAAFQPVDRVSADLAHSDDPLERGSFQFRKCAICHSLKDDGVARSGPSLEGLFGRRVGSYPGYRYSEALSKSDVIWTEKTVSQLFELGPEVFLPGTKMPLQRLPDARDRADLIAFLKARTGPGQP